MADQDDKIENPFADDPVDESPVADNSEADQELAEQEGSAEQAASEEQAAETPADLEQSAAEESVVDEKPARPANPNQRGYVVHAYSGFEAKVKESLEEHIALAGKQDSFGDILIPTEEVVEVRDGAKRRSERRK